MPTPNPDAMKFILDITLSQRLLANRGDDVEDGFTRAVLAIDGVVSVFGVNDFVTVTRVQGERGARSLARLRRLRRGTFPRAPAAHRATPSSGHVSCCAKRRSGPRQRWWRFNRVLDRPETRCR
jgi:hypothetical protein